LSTTTTFSPAAALAKIHTLISIAMGRAGHISSFKQAAPPVFSKHMAQVTLVLVKPETSAAQSAQMEQAESKQSFETA